LKFYIFTSAILKNLLKAGATRVVDSANVFLVPFRLI